jgi:transposase
MKHCSKEQREAVVNQYLNSCLSLRAFSDQQGISKSTLYTWSRKLDLNNIKRMNKTTITAEQRFSIVLETATFSEMKLSAYCREKGLYPEQVQQWKQACIDANRDGSKPVLRADKKDKNRIKELEKELHRKEKALAETAALLVLRKKFNAHYGLDEEQ